MATIVHFDIGAEDTERAKAFYEKLFDWKIEKLPGPMDYYFIRTSDLQGEPAVGGGMIKREPGRNKCIINYVGVASIEATVKQVAELGGKILQPVLPVPGFGRLAVCSDTEDNIFGVFEELAQDKQ